MKTSRKNLALLLALCLLATAAPGLAFAVPEAALLSGPGLHPVSLPALDPILLMAARGDSLAVLTHREGEGQRQLHLLRLPDLAPLARATLEAGLQLDYLAHDHLGFLSDGRIYVLSLFTGTLVLFDRGLNSREDIPFGGGGRFHTALVQEDGAVLWAADAQGRLTLFDVASRQGQPLAPQMPPGWHFEQLVAGETGRLQARYDNDEGLSLLVTVDQSGKTSLTPALPGYNWFSGGRALLSGGSTALLYTPGEEELLLLPGWMPFESPLSLTGDSLLTIHYEGAEAVFKRFSLADLVLTGRLAVPQEAGGMLFAQAVDIGEGRMLLLYQSLDLGQQQAWLWEGTGLPEGGEMAITRTTLAEIARENDAQARALENRHGLKLLLRHAGAGFVNQVYTGQPALEELRIRDALQVVDAFFERLPPGLVRESLQPPQAELDLYLAGSIQQKGQEGIMSAGGFSSQEGGRSLVVLDIRDTGIHRVLAHEFMHILEVGLEEAAAKSPWPLLFLWQRLGPREAEDFGFHYRYTDMEGYTLSDTAYTADDPEAGEQPEQVWFIDAYSRTMPLEDRARIFEHLLAADRYEDPFQYPHIRRKAQLLCALLREAYPSVAALPQAPWEERLPKADYPQLLEEAYQELQSLE